MKIWIKDFHKLLSTGYQFLEVEICLNEEEMKTQSDFKDSTAFYCEIETECRRQELEVLREIAEKFKSYRCIREEYQEEMEPEFDECFEKLKEIERRRQGITV